jgi:hypothetical protein
VLGFDFGILKSRVMLILQNNEVIINGCDLKIVEWLRLKQSNGRENINSDGTLRGILGSLHTFGYTKV